jgi:hypothetical protein
MDESALEVIQSAGSRLAEMGGEDFRVDGPFDQKGGGDALGAVPR